MINVNKRNIVYIYQKKSYRFVEKILINIKHEIMMIYNLKK